MKQSTKRFGLNDWVAYLKDKPLPVLARTPHRLQQLFTDPKVSLNQLVPIIAKDPVFTLHIIRLANELNRNDDTEANSVELAVATLGVDRIKVLAQSLPVIKLNHASVPHKQYFHSLDNSFHAATQALKFAEKMKMARARDVQIAALFYGIGHWALWRYAPKEMSAIKVEIYEDRKDPALAESDILGCTIQQIAHGLVSEWKLSSMAANALQHITSPDADTLNRLHLFDQDSAELSEKEVQTIRHLRYAHYYPAKLANWLAQTVTYGWEKPKAQSLVGLISNYLKTPIAETASFLHQNCVTGSRAYYVPGILTPAAMLMLLPSNQVLNYRVDGKKPAPAPEFFDDELIIPHQGKNTLFAKQSTPDAAPDKPAIEIADTKTTTANKTTSTSKTSEPVEEVVKYNHEKQFRELMNKLLHTPLSYRADSHIYTDLMHALKGGLGIERIAIFLVDSESLAKPMMQVGFKEKDPVRKYEHDLEVPGIFKAISHKSVAIQLHEPTHDKIWPQLPERFKAWSNPNAFFLASIVIDNDPAAFVYGDMGLKTASINPFYFRQFKNLCAATSRCLKARKSVVLE